MSDQCETISLSASLVETAVLIMACNGQHATGVLTPIVDVEALRAKFLRNVKPISLTAAEALWIYSAVRKMSVDQDGKWVDRGDAKSRVLALLEHAWASQIGGTLADDSGTETAS